MRGGCSVRIATGRAFVTGGNENGNACGGGLLISGVEGGIRGGAIYGFAFAVADADDGGERLPAFIRFWRAIRPPKVVVFRAGCQFDCGIGSGGAGIFCVEDCFAVVGIHSGIGAVIRENSDGLA